MIRIALLLVATASCGCSFGFGSAYVGQWRAHEEVEYRACLEDDTGKCIEQKEYVKHVPARSYWGATFTSSVGAGFVTDDGNTTPRARWETSLEFLRGRGRAAYGVRVGGISEIRAAFLPVMLLGHFSVHERLGLYGGAGVIPWALHAGHTNETADLERYYPGYVRPRRQSTSNFGARALIGLQWMLARMGHESYLVVSLEADTYFVNFDRPYRSTGFTGSLGFYF